MKRLSPQEYRAAEKTPIVVVLDNLRSGHNIGSAFRTADAFRIEKIMLCGISAPPPSAEIHKTALGAEDSVEWKYFEKTEDAITELTEQGYTALAVEQTENSLPLHAFAPEKTKKYALVFGNEVKGVGQKVLDMCEACIEIPQFGTKHSLNVSVSVGVALWHFFEL
ncbi:MAG: RNA methyltransferase, partial [Prevotellaceae bacterium]|nr:RNA methyltransferase [Prevotellaceae bacterium]